MPQHDAPGVPESGEADVDASAGSTPVTILNLRDDCEFHLENIHIEYPSSASSAFALTFYDEPDGTASGNLTRNRKEALTIQPGEVRGYDDLNTRAFQNDVVAEPDGNGDATARIYVDGKKIVLD